MEMQEHGDNTDTRHVLKIIGGALQQWPTSTLASTHCPCRCSSCRCSNASIGNIHY
jgi:hypothetical protein